MAQPQDSNESNMTSKRSLHAISSPARVQDGPNYSCCLLSLKKKKNGEKRDLAASFPSSSPGSSTRWAETAPAITHDTSLVLKRLSWLPEQSCKNQRV